MRVVGISGSLRRNSHNTGLLRSAAPLLAEDDELEVYRGLKSIPPFDEDDEHTPPEAVTRLRRAIEAADAVLVATPEYNSSIPGHLKNALDWMSRPRDQNPLRDKPAAVVGASTGMFGALWSQAEARKVLASIGARVVDEELPVLYAHEQFNEDGALAEDELRERYAEILGRLRGLVEERKLAAA